MSRQIFTAGTFRPNAAILLSLAAAYLLATEFIIEPWSACIAFGIVFAITAAVQIRALGRDFELHLSWLLVPLGLAALWGPAQLIAGVPQYRFDTWWSSLSWAAALAFFWCGLQVFSPPRVSDAFRWGAIIFGALIALEAILQLFAGGERVYGLLGMHEDRLPMGPFRNRDHFSALMELLLPLALWTGIRRPRRAWICFTAAGAMFAAVIASTSRAGAAIATLEVILLLVVGILRKRAGTVAPVGRLTVAIAVLVAAGGGVVGWTPVLDRFQVKDLFLYRREFLESTLLMIRDRPWFGFGLGSWPWVYPRYAIIDPILVANHAHNDWAEWAACGGIPFALLIGLIALRAVWLSLEMPWGIGTVAVFAHATVDFPLARPPLLVAVLLVLAVMELEHARRLRGRRPEVERSDVRGVSTACSGSRASLAPLSPN
jgi:O-antigen ligase